MERPSLAAHLPTDGPAAPDAILEGFLDWLGELGLTPYAYQEDAFLELVAGRHLVLGTPTGSGKSLVALFLHWKALCEGRRSFYTAPTKALVSEKFFALCTDLGPERVGMLTGAASITRASARRRRCPADSVPAGCACAAPRPIWPSTVSISARPTGRRRPVSNARFSCPVSSGLSPSLCAR